MCRLIGKHLVSVTREEKLFTSNLIWRELTQLNSQATLLCWAKTTYKSGNAFVYTSRLQGCSLTCKPPLLRKVVFTVTRFHVTQNHHEDLFEHKANLFCQPYLALQRS